MDQKNLFDKIKKHVLVLEFLFRNSYTFFHDSKFLHTHTHSEDAPDEFKFLGRVGISHYIVSVLELAKIVIDSPYNHFDIYTLFDQIESYNSSTVQKKIEIITDLYRHVLKDNYENTIQSIRDLRNKAFAHTDNEILDPGYTFKLTFTEIEDLLQFLNDLIDELNKKVLDKSKQKYNLDSGAQNTYKLVEANI